MEFEANVSSTISARIDCGKNKRVQEQKKLLAIDGPQHLITIQGEEGVLEDEGLKLRWQLREVFEG